MKNQIVLVLWDDSNVTHGWQVYSQWQDSVAHCRTVGFLKRETDQSITLAFGESSCGSILETITIPKGSITKTLRLRVR